jgi:hypothetical protein
MKRNVSSAMIFLHYPSLVGFEPGSYVAKEITQLCRTTKIEDVIIVSCDPKFGQTTQFWVILSKQLMRQIQ